MILSIIVERYDIDKIIQHYFFYFKKNNVKYTIQSVLEIINLERAKPTSRYAFIAFIQRKFRAVVGTAS